MKLIDLNEGDNISLEVIYSGKNYEFTTNVLGKLQDFILSDPVKSNDDKVVGFSGDGIMVNLIHYRKDKLPIVWKGIGCTLVQYKGKMQYKIVSSGEGYELNRRNAFRLILGNEGVVQIGINRKAVDVLIKDVSETGFAFVSEDDIEDAEEMAVRAVFYDDNQSMALVGKVVRKVVMEGDKILYGCRLNVPNHSLSRYINEKQRIKLAAGRGVSMHDQNEIQNRTIGTPRTVKGNTNSRNEKTYSKRKMLDTTPKLEEIDKEERRQFFSGNRRGRKV